MAVRIPHLPDEDQDVPAEEKPGSYWDAYGRHLAQQQNEIDKALASGAVQTGPTGWASSYTDPASAEALRQEQFRKQQIKPAEPYRAAPRLDNQGADKFRHTLGQAPAQSGTAEYDKWLVQLPDDPTDLQYNGLLTDAKHKAVEREVQRRQRASEESDVASLKATSKTQSKSKAAADERIREPGRSKQADEEFFLGEKKAKWAEVWAENSSALIYDVYGRRVADPDLEHRGKTYPSQSEYMTPGKEVTAADGSVTFEPEGLGTDGPNAGELWKQRDYQANQIVDAQKLANTGNYVYAGQRTVKAPNGQMVVKDSYMNRNDAFLRMRQWSPQMTANFQEDMGLDVSGYADEDTAKAWALVVESGAKDLAAGIKRPLEIVAQAYADANAYKKKSSGGGGGGGRGGGGGGGGGGGEGIPAEVLTSYLNAAMSQYVGREANSGELSAFISMAGGATTTATLQQLAIDFVKKRSGSEVGSFQAATTYYDAMMSVLGGGV